MDRTEGRNTPVEPVEGSLPEYDPESHVYRVPFDPSDSGTVGEVVVENVATIEGVEATALPALYDVVDPEAVDRLVGTAGRETTPGNVVVEFPYAGYTVAVHPGEVLVGPPGGGTD